MNLHLEALLCPENPSHVRLPKKLNIILPVCFHCGFGEENPVNDEEMKELSSYRCLPCVLENQ